MVNFEYYTPTKVVFGKGTQSQAGELVKQCGGKKALLHYGGQSAERSGLLSEVEQSLQKAGVDYVSLGGVVPNPRMALAYEGIELCKKEGVDFILAVGGGSVIDSAKAISLGAANGFDVWDLFRGKAQAQAALPVGAVLTVAAAGSEMSNSVVMTLEDGLKKRAYKSDLNRCAFAILNPELTFTLPEYETQSGCVDIMMHTLERWFQPEKQPLELTGDIAASLLRGVMKQARVLLKNPRDYMARAEVMWAGSLSHNGLTGCGAGPGDWAAHQIEMELSGMFDVAHGAGLAAVWGSWARYVMDTDYDRFALLATKVFGVEDTGESAAELAEKGVRAAEAFFRSIHMPTSVKEMGIELTEAQIEELAYKCSFEETRAIGSFKVLHRKDMEEIYRMASK